MFMHMYGWNLGVLTSPKIQAKDGSTDCTSLEKQKVGTLYRLLIM